MKRKHLATIGHLFLSLSLAGTAAFAPLGGSSSVIWGCLAIFYGYSAMVVATPNVTNTKYQSVVTGEVLFLVFTYLVLFLPYQLSVLGISEIWVSRFVDFTFGEYTNPSLLATTSGVVAFCAGVKSLPVAVIQSQREPRDCSGYADSFCLIIIALLVAAIAAQVVGGSLASLAEGSYAGSSTNDRTLDGLYFVGTLLAMIAIAGSVYRCSRFGFGIVPAIGAVISCAWAATILLMGDRNSFLLIAIVGLCGSSHFFFSMSRIKLTAMILIALLGYSVVEEARQSSTRGVAAVATALGNAGNADFSESSFTNTTVGSRAAFALAPGIHGFYMGKFKLIGFAGVIPYSRGLFVSENDEAVTSSDVISAGVLGFRPTWSLGTNVISDIYLDFGVIGIPPLMFLAGLCLAAFSMRFARTKSLYCTVIYLVSAACFAELPRYSFDFPVRPIVWTMVLLAMHSFGWRLMTTSKSWARTDNVGRAP